MADESEDEVPVPFMCTKHTYPSDPSSAPYTTMPVTVAHTSQGLGVGAHTKAASAECSQASTTAKGNNALFADGRSSLPVLYHHAC